MACLLGKEGILKLDGTAVGELKNFELDITANLAECTKMGDDWVSEVTTQKTWSVSGEYNWDPDATAQSAIVAGTELTAALYFEGDSTGDVEYSGTVIVESVTVAGSFDDIVMGTVTLKGKGALTTGAVA